MFSVKISSRFTRSNGFLRSSKLVLTSDCHPPLLLCKNHFFPRQYKAVFNGPSTKMLFTINSRTASAASSGGDVNSTSENKKYQQSTKNDQKKQSEDAEFVSKDGQRRSTAKEQYESLLKDLDMKSKVPKNRNTFRTFNVFVVILFIVLWIDRRRLGLVYNELQFDFHNLQKDYAYEVAKNQQATGEIFKELEKKLGRNNHIYLELKEKFLLSSGNPANSLGIDGSFEIVQQPEERADHTEVHHEIVDGGNSSNTSSLVQLNAIADNGVMSNALATTNNKNNLKNNEDSPTTIVAESKERKISTPPNGKIKTTL